MVLSIRHLHRVAHSSFAVWPVRYVGNDEVEWLPCGSVGIVRIPEILMVAGGV